MDRRGFVALALSAAAAPAIAAGSPAARGTRAETTARVQLDWLLDATTRAPVPAAELQAHLAAPLLDAAGGPAGANAILVELGPLALRTVVFEQPARLKAVASGTSGMLLIDLHVDASGLVDGLRLSPYAPTPASWSELDGRLRALAPLVGFAAATVRADGRVRVAHAVHGDVARPLGSAFKLYVLGALHQAIAAHRASWDQILPIHEEWKSLPSGVLQNQPAGTPFTLRQYARYMISISDNTAADHLVHFLGRESVEAQLLRFRNAHAIADVPFLTTRELFALKGFRYPTLADRYLGLPRPLRRLELPALDQVPRIDITGWSVPRNVTTIEWFGAPTDICRAYAGLWGQHDPEAGAALSIEDGGIGLDPVRYPTVWFKGGSEPGVFTLNYLAGAADGRVLVTSLLLANPDKAFDESAIAGEALAIARGGIELNGSGGG